MLQQLHVFPCNEWLEYDSKKGGLENCKRELLTGALAAASGLTQYKVRQEGRAEQGGSREGACTGGRTAQGELEVRHSGIAES